MRYRSRALFVVAAWLGKLASRRNPFQVQWRVPQVSTTIG